MRSILLSKSHGGWSVFRPAPVNTPLTRRYAWWVHRFYKTKIFLVLISSKLLETRFISGDPLHNHIRAMTVETIVFCSIQDRGASVVVAIVLWSISTCFFFSNFVSRYLHNYVLSRRVLRQVGTNIRLLLCHYSRRAPIHPMDVSQHVDNRQTRSRLFSTARPSHLFTIVRVFVSAYNVNFQKTSHSVARKRCSETPSCGGVNYYCQLPVSTNKNCLLIKDDKRRRRMWARINRFGGPRT